MTPKEFAILKHANQFRKYTREPYWKHCEEVAGIISSFYGENSIMVDVAWLHDTVEDTDTTLQEIEYFFGTTTAELVFWLTDPNIKGNRAIRKGMARAQISRAPLPAKIVKLADMISNTKSITVHDPDFAKVYMREKRRLLEEFNANCKVIVETELYSLAKKIVDDYFIANPEEEI